MIFSVQVLWYEARLIPEHLHWVRFTQLYKHQLEL